MIQYPNYKHVVSLNNATGTGAGASIGGVDTPVANQPIPRSPSTVFSVLIPGGPVATVTIQAMVPSGTWVTLQSFTLNGTDVYASFPATFIDIRANCTAYTSGNVYVWIGAL